MDVLFYSEAGPGLPAVQIQQMPAYGALNFADQYTAKILQNPGPSLVPLMRREEGKHFDPKTIH